MQRIRDYQLATARIRPAGGYVRCVRSPSRLVTPESLKLNVIPHQPETPVDLTTSHRARDDIRKPRKNF
jgi:hypothetical protein